MIYYFGDSHTAGMGKAPENLKIDYEHIPYSVFLSDMLGMECKNFAGGGFNLVKNTSLLIQNLKDIIDNAKIVIFQFQFFSNGYLRFKNENKTWKDLVVGHREIFEFDEFNDLSNDDKISISNYFYKFEERRSWYEMEKVYHIFDFLESYGIKCYALYWAVPVEIEIIDSPERNITMDGTVYIGKLKFKKTIEEETNGIWKDNHIGTNSNKIIAEKIYQFIKNKRDVSKII